MTEESIYDTTEGVARYVEVAEGHDGRAHIERLGELLPAGSEVLELGMGPGIDLDMLARRYQATGSDRSQAFLDRYAATHAEADLLRLDAVAIDTPRRFDAIYSNKVLHHLTTDDMARSLRRQAELIRPAGILLHGLWAGVETESYQGLISQNYTAETFAAVVPTSLKLIECSDYDEMAPNDSIRVVLCRVDPAPGESP